MTTTQEKTETKALVYVNNRLTVKTTPTEDSAKENHPLAENLADFMQRVDDIYFSVTAMVPATSEILKRRAAKIDKIFADA